MTREKCWRKITSSDKHYFPPNVMNISTSAHTSARGRSLRSQHNFRQQGWSNHLLENDPLNVIRATSSLFSPLKRALPHVPKTNGSGVCRNRHQFCMKHLWMCFGGDLPLNRKQGGPWWQENSWYATHLINYKTTWISNSSSRQISKKIPWEKRI